MHQGTSWRRPQCWSGEAGIQGTEEGKLAASEKRRQPTLTPVNFIIFYYVVSKPVEIFWKFSLSRGLALDGREGARGQGAGGNPGATQ